MGGAGGDDPDHPEPPFAETGDFGSFPRHPGRIAWPVPQLSSSPRIDTVVAACPLASSNPPPWVRLRSERKPLVQITASWTSCRASRGSTRSDGWPVQPHSKSQVPRRKCSAANSQSPSKLPWTLSANNCRTPRSRLTGSHGLSRVCRRVRWISISVRQRFRQNASVQRWRGECLWRKAVGRHPGWSHLRPAGTVGVNMVSVATDNSLQCASCHLPVTHLYSLFYA